MADQSNTTEAGGSPAANTGGDKTSTGWPDTAGGEAVTEQRKNSQETYATGIPTALDEDPESDRVTSGFPHIGEQAKSRPGSPGGEPGPITNLGFNPNAVMGAPSTRRVGKARQQFTQAPNKG